MTQITKTKTAPTPMTPCAAGAPPSRKTPTTRAPKQHPSATPAGDAERTQPLTLGAKPEASAPKGKIGTLIGLLLRDAGADIDEMIAVTGWQAHSVRGAISGSIKKALGLNVISEKTDCGRRYRIVLSSAAE